MNMFQINGQRGTVEQWNTQKKKGIIIEVHSG